MSYVACGDAPLLNCGRRYPRCIRGRNGGGRITDYKYFRVAFQLEVRIHDGAADTIVRTWQRFNQFSGANPGFPRWGLTQTSRYASRDSRASCPAS